MTGMICGILLAAGTSRRFGSDKLLAPINNNTPMAIVSARNFLASVDTLAVIVHSDSGELVKLLQNEKLNIIYCRSAQKGMSESIKEGIERTIEADGWVIALADMPFIHSSTFSAVSAKLRNGAALVAPYYDNRRGHPVGFSNNYRDELMRLQGDRGAASILDRHLDSICSIECEDPAIHIDIDTPEDRLKYILQPHHTLQI